MDGAAAVDHEELGITFSTKVQSKVLNFTQFLKNVGTGLHARHAQGLHRLPPSLPPSRTSSFPYFSFPYFLPPSLPTGAQASAWTSPVIPILPKSREDVTSLEDVRKGKGKGEKGTMSPLRPRD